jgi:alpha-ketoglutaric semialdehyde dehydrogenase
MISPRRPGIVRGLSGEEQGNLVGGQRRASRGAGRFELRAALAPWDSLGAWPRSDSRDLEAPLRLAGEGARSWGRRSPEERWLLLERAAQALGRERDEPELAAALGMDLPEAASHRDHLAGEFDELDPRLAEGRSGGIALCLPHWTELFAGTLRAVGEELFRGRAVLLFPDPRLPFPADRVADALLEAGLPPSALSVVHGIEEEAVIAAIGGNPGRHIEGNVVSVRASGSSRRILALRRACEAAGTAGPCLSLLRSAAWEVDRELDLEESARRVVEAAFGRVSTLSGQRAGRIGRVHCPERLHSRFTEALLAVLETSRDGTDPLPLIDRKALEAVRASWAGALDRGATQIFGGRAPACEEGRRSSRRLLPTVFTNAEGAGGGETPSRPEPILHLFRIRGGG